MKRLYKILGIDRNASENEFLFIITNKQKRSNERERERERESLVAEKTGFKQSILSAFFKEVKN
ncbi:hypothetical protein [endosymbiont GvMRE of Glomus versiforme]|uniref:hypothetical protein n=1 Tax=endosymbiont GvMRE of Glomus versiforme TaxID=2039283 RepID=UPI000EC55A48|nr:hypothetical protein [endosymbiont GvMRE of Glomus versiforme]RHZ36698.1 hypothetical protein GvMRE_I2g373 [endosymbiont GvMRE of Glomus versiforme]